MKERGEEKKENFEHLPRRTEASPHRSLPRRRRLLAYVLPFLLSLKQFLVSFEVSLV